MHAITSAGNHRLRTIILHIFFKTINLSFRKRFVFYCSSLRSMVWSIHIGSPITP